ncbi:MAG: hypothetical protein NTZ95_03440 [Candidatus Omnitrophica bacterium]|nr:hypothetical protein [Candidatus Omnitrophota bacterium]
MAKIIFFTFLLAVFIMIPVFAKSQGMSLTATGYEWLGYSPEEKRAFANLIHIALNKKKGAYNTNDVIKKLDDFYYSALEKAKSDPLNFDENKYLKVPCIKVINN